MFDKATRKQNRDQALALFQRYLELPLGGNLIFEEAQYDTYDGPIKGDKDPSTLLVDEYFIKFNLFHDLSSYALRTTAIEHEDDNWVKGFFLLVLSEEQEALTPIHGDLMREPFPYQ